MRSIEAQYAAQDAARDDIIKLASGLQAPMFATKGSIGEAYEYAYTIIETLEPKDKVAVITAMQVLINTIAEQVKQVGEV